MFENSYEFLNLYDSKDVEVIEDRLIRDYHKNNLKTNMRYNQEPPKESFIEDFRRPLESFDLDQLDQDIRKQEIEIEEGD